ncbi:MAG: hypothetical protein Q9191_002399 [Dirinaria sp. TL-2023a]
MRKHSVQSNTALFSHPQADLFKAIRGGPQPRNTLKDSYTSHFLRQNNLVSAKPSTATTQGLRLQRIRGDNVPKPTRSSISSAEFDNSPAKRQKIEPDMEEQTSSQFTGSDELDRLGFDDGLVPSLAKGNQTASQTLLGLGLSSDRPRTSLGRVQEYINVENRMRSNPNRNRRNRKPRAKDVVQLDSTESKAQAGSTPINISDDEHEAPVTHPSKYKGTAGEVHKSFLAQTPPTASMRDTGEQSRHFASRQPKITEVNPVVKILTPTKNKHTNHEEQRLNDKFIATNGKRKNQDFMSSPDALQGDTTVGRFRNKSDVKPDAKPDTSRQASPSKSSSSTRKGSPIKDSQRSLSPSRIRASTFSSVKGNATGSKSHVQKDAQQEADPHWGIQLASVNGRGKVLKSSSLGLEYDEKIESFDVINNSMSLGKDDLTFRVQIPKLKKVLWSIGGAEVRFESARIEGADFLLDIELHKESEVTALMAKLQEKYSNIKIMGKDRDIMKKMFANRLEQQKAANGKRSNPAVDDGMELQMKIKRKAERDKELGLAMPEEKPVKRRRINDRIVDSIRDENRGTAVFQTPWNAKRDFQGEALAQSAIRSQYGEARRAAQQDSPTSRPVSPSGISNVLHNLKAKPEGTYTTRSKTGHKHGAVKASPSILDDPPRIRYSQVNNLGKPWCKPLTYPKTGKKKVTVEWADLERLDDGEFLNDNLIAFYLRYLEQQLEEKKPHIAKRIYFFNTFFYTNLTKHGRSHRNISYELVEKWTRNVDIFTYDYVVVPINESYHWYVAVICNLPSLNRTPPRDDDERILSTFTDIDLILHDQAVEKSSGSPAQQEDVDKEEPPTEQETRRSFAEMSLDQQSPSVMRRNENGDIEAEDQAAGDQDMLDAQIKVDLAGASAQPEEHDPVPTVRQEEAGQNMPSEQEPSPIAAGTNKRGKRKSMPPGKKLHPSEPAIITFDSLPTPHPATVRALKDYLHAEAESKRGMRFDEKQLKGMTAAGIPKQDNFCDCGPFLLGYMDKFMDDPQDFISKTMQKQFDCERDWPSLVPSKLRANIRELLLGLYQEQDDERRENAKKTGKYVSKTSGSTSRAVSPRPTTRKEALKSALPDGRPAVPSKPSRSRSTSPAPEDTIDPSLQNETSVIVVDSQSKPPPKASKHHHRSPTPPELPSTIQDSQPGGDSFEQLEEELPPTPRPAPLPQATAVSESIPSSSAQSKGEEHSPTRSHDATRTLNRRSNSPRQARSGKERPDNAKKEVVELDSDSSASV